MRTSTAFLELLKAESDCRQFFTACCKTSPLLLRSQAWQFRDKLKATGHEFENEDLEDTLFELACILFLDSPAAQWDTDWAGELASQAVHYLAERNVHEADLSVLEPWEEKIVAAGIAEDRRAYREAIQGYVKAGVKAFEERKRGAA